MAKPRRCRFYRATIYDGKKEWCVVVPARNMTMVEMRFEPLLKKLEYLGLFHVDMDISVHGCIFTVPDLGIVYTKKDRISFFRLYDYYGYEIDKEFRRQGFLKYRPFLFEL